MKGLRLAARVSGLKPSPTLAITARATAMRAQGLDVISFAAGEPDFQTPEPICRAAIEAMQSGFTKYTAGRGLTELRALIADKLGRENGIPVRTEGVIVTCGAKHALFNALLSLVDPGDEVLIVGPFWMTYAEQVAVAGGRAIVVNARAEDAYIPSVEAIAAAITPHTKVLMVCSPNNPTGAVWPREVFEGVADLVLRHDLWLLSDEVYEKLIYEGEHVSPAALDDEVAARTVTIGSCSKTYAMTGWRIGFAAGPERVLDAMAAVQDQISHPTSFAMKGAIAAFQMPDTEVERMREEFRLRRDLMYDALMRIDGLKAARPPGAFYVFADARGVLGDRFADDLALAEFLLTEAHVAAIPGSVFYAPGTIRFSYAASRDDIQRGVARIAEALDRTAV